MRTSDNESISGLREIIAELNRQNVLMRQVLTAYLATRNIENIGDQVNAISLIDAQAIEILGGANQ